jgi:hypothetical protein
MLRLNDAVHNEDAEQYDQACKTDRATRRHVKLVSPQRAQFVAPWQEIDLRH